MLLVLLCCLCLLAMSFDISRSVGHRYSFISLLGSLNLHGVCGSWVLTVQFLVLNRHGVLKMSQYSHLGRLAAVLNSH